MQEHLVLIIGVGLGNNLIVNITGTAFSAVSTSPIYHTKKELSQEEIAPLNDTTTSKTSKLSYIKSQVLEDSQLVAFKDPLNDKYVLLSLKTDTMDTLKSHFQKDDFYERDDGILRLNNKAEAYVAGWFGDIAYKRKFLESDSNNDGILNKSEYSQTKNSFKHSGEVLGHGKFIDRISTWISGVYESSNDIRKNIINQLDAKENVSIDKQLNKSIKKDVNLDSKISFAEALSSHYKKNIRASIINLADDMVGLDIPKDNLIFLEEDLILKLLEQATKEQLKREEALEKLKHNNGDISLLSTDEKHVITQEIKKSKNEDGTLDINKLKDIINYNKTTQIYKEEKSQEIGKYYEEKG